MIGPAGSLALMGSPGGLISPAIIAGFLDADDAFHTAADERVRHLVGQDRLVASVISYAELLTGAASGHHGEQAVRGYLRDLVDTILPVLPTVAERAAELRSRRTVGLPDALILATAELAGADLAMTGDERWAGSEACAGRGGPEARGGLIAYRTSHRAKGADRLPLLRPGANMCSP